MRVERHRICYNTLMYKDIEKRKARDKRYYQENREAIKLRERKRYQANRKAIRARRQEMTTSEYRVKAAERERRRYNDLRTLVIEHYGNQCACCGETEPLFLEIDHINNDGKGHRQIIGSSGKALVFWLVENNYPDGFQILCSNCNQGKKRNKGICPHRRKER